MYTSYTMLCKFITDIHVYIVKLKAKSNFYNVQDSYVGLTVFN